VAAHREAAGLLVSGGRLLSGSVRTSGFKHSLVTVLAAAAAASATVRIRNCPDITETRVLAELLRAHGARASYAGSTLTVDAGELHPPRGDADADRIDADRIHGAVYLVPAVLRRTGVAQLPVAGGCQIGDGPAMRRPVEQYVSVLQRFGARLSQLPDGRWEVRADVLRGTDVDLLDYAADRRLRSGPLYSGATKMALLTAVVSQGVSTLRNLYPKPDVTDLVDVLRDLGADLESPRDGTVVVHGRGGDDLCRDAEHTLLPDLIEIVTWLCAGLTLSAESLRIQGAGMDRALRALAPELAALERMGAPIDAGPSTVVVARADRLNPIDLTAASHGVYSDSQPFFSLLAAQADGTSRITDRVWRNRFTFTGGLAALGMRIRRDGDTVSIAGPCRPARVGQRVVAPDLRAAAVLLLAALAVPGTTRIAGSHHLARGYPDLPGALRGLGAQISVITDGVRS
jgi:UDP-N-acetylglucosamine enolpyruvyl transferase